MHLNSVEPPPSLLALLTPSPRQMARAGHGWVPVGGGAGGEYLIVILVIIMRANDGFAVNGKVRRRRHWMNRSCARRSPPRSCGASWRCAMY